MITDANHPRHMSSLSTEASAISNSILRQDNCTAARQSLLVTNLVLFCHSRQFTIITTPLGASIPSLGALEELAPAVPIMIHIMEGAFPADITLTLLFPSSLPKVSTI